jgi:DNA-binding response OmpR family regulator
VDPAAPSVLLVEDDRDTRDLFVLLLEGAGFHMRSAETVDEAVRLILESPPDVLVADYTLPDGTAADIMERLPATSRPHGILLTGFEAERVAGFGFYRILQKPVTPERLIATIHERPGAPHGAAT